MIGQAFEHHAKQLGVAGREKHPGMECLKDLQYRCSPANVTCKIKRLAALMIACWYEI